MLQQDQTLSPTNASHSIGTETDELLGEIISRLTERLERGEPVDLARYEQEFPDQLDQIGQLLPTLRTIVRLGRASNDSSLSTNHLQPESTKAPDKLLGDYRIIEEIGRGGMGVVYRAEQISMGRTVALKVLPFAAVMDEKAITRFKNEARAAGTLHHENIVPVHAVGSEHGVYYYAMALIQGLTVAEVIHELKQRVLSSDRLDPDQVLVNQVVSNRCDTPVETESGHSRQFDLTADFAKAASGKDEQETEHVIQNALSTRRSLFGSRFYEQVASMGMQTADALHHAHEHGIVHRDIKPGNLMVDPTGKIWVTDFGLARIESDAGMTMTGDILGTLRYMAPEQALAKRIVVDHRADIYSLGVTLYELLTMRPVFDAANREGLLKQLTFDEPKPIRQIQPTVPRDLETVVMKAISKNPDERYATAGEMAEDLKRFLADQPIHARRLTILQRAAKWSKRQRKPLSFVAASLLVASAVGVAALEKSRLTLLQVVDERDHALAQLQKERDELNDANARLREAYDKLEAQNTHVLETRQRARSVMAGTWELNDMILDLMLSGQRDAASKLSEQRFVRIINSLQEDDQQHAKSLAPLLPTYIEGAIRPARSMTCDGRRFNDGSVALAPRLVYDGTPPITIDSIHICEQLTDNEQNLLSWTSAGSIGLCTSGCRRWAFWLGDVSHGSQAAYTKIVEKDPIQLNVKRHIAGVWDGNEARIYVDGVLQAVKAINSTALRKHVTGHPLQFAADPSYDFSTNEPFLGVIVAARVTRATLYAENFDPPQELRNVDGCVGLYDFRFDDGDYAYDRSGNGNHAILANTEKLPAESLDGRRDMPPIASPELPSAEKLVSRGILHQEMDEHEQALEAYREASQLDSDNDTSRRNQGLLLVKLKKYKEAITALTQWIALESGNKHAWVARGDSYLRLGKLELALADIRQAFHLDSTNASYVSVFGPNDLKNCSESFRRDLIEFADTVVNYVDNAEAYRRRGQLYMFLDEMESAVADYSEALRRDPENSAYWDSRYLNRGHAYARLGRWEEALADYTEGVERFPDNPDVLFWRVEALNELARWDEAVTEAERLIKLQPDRGHHYYWCALAKLAISDSEGYRQICAQMLQQFSESGDKWLAWTCALAPGALLDLSPAVELDEDFVQENPTDRWRLNSLCAVLFRAGKFADAAKNLSEVHRFIESSDVELSFSPAYTWFFLAMTHHRLGNAEEAKLWFDKANEQTDSELGGIQSEQGWQRRQTLQLLRREAGGVFAQETQGPEDQESADTSRGSNAEE